MTTYTVQAYDVVLNADETAATSLILVDVTFSLQEGDTFFTVASSGPLTPTETPVDFEFTDGLTITVDGEIIDNDSTDAAIGGLILDEGNGTAGFFALQTPGAAGEIFFLTSADNFVGPDAGFIDPIASASDFNDLLARIDDDFNLGTGRFGFPVTEFPFITAISEDDIFQGTLDRDSIDGGLGNDVIRGLAGSDLLSGGDGEDDINGGKGGDTVSGEGGADLVAGGAGNDLVLGGLGDDELHGDRGNDFMMGGANKDMLMGGRARDQLMGEAGNDTLNGGGWVDTLTGGEGRDTFVFEGDFYKDYVDDFEDNRDTLLFDSRLWAGDLTAEEIVDQFAEQRANQIAFNFEDAGGEFTGRVILRGFTDISALANDIEIF